MKETIDARKHLKSWEIMEHAINVGGEIPDKKNLRPTVDALLSWPPIDLTSI
jgi:hypothetical protein